MVTVVPAVPELGENELTAAGRTTAKLPALVPVPLEVVTATLPVVAVFGTVVVIVSSSTTLTGAEAPLNVTFVAPVKLWPWIVTVWPRASGDVSNESTRGTTLNFAVLVVTVFDPAALSSRKALVEAPTGIVTFSCVSLTGVIARSVVASLAAVTCARFVPLIVTVVPTGAEVGLNELTVGGSTTVKLAALVAVPPGVVTASLPVVAVGGIVAVICMSESCVNVALTPLNVTFVAPVKL